MATPASGSRAERGPGGWTSFAGVVLFIAGTFGMIWGLAALLNDEVVTVGGHGGVIVWDFTAWGWIHLIVGALMIVTSLGLFAVRGWARWMGIVFATLNAIIQVGALPAFPIWSLIVLSLDVIVIYQLTTHYEYEG